MAIGVVLILSILSAAGTAFACGAFESLAWLWALPLGFVGAFLSIVLLIFLVVLVMSLLVNMDRPQEEDSPAYRWVTQTVIALAIPLLRIRIHATGLEKAPKCRRVLLVCNHIHEIDPAVLLHCFPQYRLAFVSKKENEKKPFIGPFLHRLLCQSVNRENDREALKTILNCIRLLKEDNVSIAVFPEGYVSRDRKLHPFRSGVFKIATKANVPIVVCTLRNTHLALGNAMHLKPTDIHMHLVGVLQPEDYAGMTAVDIGSRVYDMMAADLGPTLVLPTEEMQN